MVVASRRAEALAAEFRRENEALIALVTGMDEHDWTADCSQEGRSVGVVVGHIAGGHMIIGGAHLRETRLVRTAWSNLTRCPSRRSGAPGAGRRSTSVSGPTGCPRTDRKA